ncbi:MAG: hypothetical protein ACTHLX_20200, partial [Candidatus Binatia bacterium]
VLVRAFRKASRTEDVPPATRSLRAGRRELEHLLGLDHPHAYIIYEMQAVVAQQIEGFKKFPPRQKPASFNLDAVLRTLEEASGGGQH